MDLYYNDLYALNKTINEVRKMPEISRKKDDEPEIVLSEFENIVKQIYEIHQGQPKEEAPVLRDFGNVHIYFPELMNSDSVQTNISWN